MSGLVHKDKSIGVLGGGRGKTFTRKFPFVIVVFLIATKIPWTDGHGNETVHFSRWATLPAEGLKRQ